MTAISVNKSTLLNWCLWFCFGNAVLFWLIGLNYFSTISWLDTDYLSSHAKQVLMLFIGLAYTGQLGVLAFFPCLFLVPIIYLIPRRNLIFFIAIILASLAATFLVIDLITYKLYRFHVNGVMFNIIFNGLVKEVLGLSWLECILAIGIITGFLLLEFSFAFVLWRFCHQKPFFKGKFKWVVILISLCLYSSYCMIAFSAGFLLNRVLVDVARTFPFYTETFVYLLPAKGSKTAIERLSEAYLIQPDKINVPLNYPMQALSVKSDPKPKNILIIGLDAWRFDMMNKEVTPNIYKIAQQSLQFTNHFSGGNATGPGLFSLFYGLPESYWTAMESQQRAPVLMDELRKLHYQMGVFTSATLKLPPFNKTIFLGVKDLNLTTPGENSYERDKAITREFNKFIEDVGKQKKPFFSFLFYDSSHSYCSFHNEITPFIPAVERCNRMELTNHSDPLPYLNRYKNAVYFVDQQIKEVLATLRKHHLLNNTVIIFTGDHGEEFNDNHLGYWSHASNFTRFQTQTPLIVYWPGETAQLFKHKTSHFDIAPTLLSKLLNCELKPEQYSLGRSLFDRKLRPYLLISSYIDWGIVTPDRIIQVSSMGDFRVQKLNGEPLPQEKPDLSVLKEVFTDLRRFYKS